MFFKYLWRELAKRRKQTTLIASGLAVAIALVVVVAGVSDGIKQAQSQALSGLYGIGTDLTISKTQSFTPGQGGQRFQFGASGGTTTSSKQTFNRSRLEVARGSATLTQAQVDKVAATSGVATAVATLKLNATTFNGTLPTFGFNRGGQSSQSGQGSQSGQQGGNAFVPPTTSPSTAASPTASPSASASSTTSASTAPSGGFDGKGGSSFSITSFSVEGVSTSVTKVGPLTAATLTSGRLFTAADASKNVTVLDASYAKTNSLKVGKTVTMGGTRFTVIGIVQSSSASATTPSNAYIPIKIAQTLSGSTSAYTTVYVAATSSDVIDSTKSALQKTLGSTVTVSSESDLAANVSGSLATSSNLINQMGSWLALLVLLAAFATSILFTTSGVNRRVREFGTLKAIGWRSRRIVVQVMGESLVTGILGGVLGLALGVGAIAIINAVGPTLSASVSSGNFFGGPGGFGGQAMQSGQQSGSGGPGFGGPGGFQQQASNAMNIVLHSSVQPWMVGAAIGFAIIGGLLAGIFGGLRAARLSPAQALRSLA